MNFMGFFVITHWAGNSNRYAIITKMKCQSYNLKHNHSESDVDFLLSLENEYSVFYHQFYSAHTSLVNIYSNFPGDGWPRESYVSG